MACMGALSIRRARPAPRVRHRCLPGLPPPDSSMLESASALPPCAPAALQAAASLFGHEKAVKGMSASTGALGITKAPSIASRSWCHRLQRPLRQHHFEEVYGHRHHVRRLPCR